ncbi:MAG: hypothetical protein CVV04_09280 [Firmicutes bacterium HGW-Firmicutes-9]|nr:MAG: hypothetical protein CVV04_09280 [Firmicutes bacterium HGW-Firmicutes-9]
MGSGVGVGLGVGVAVAVGVGVKSGTSGAVLQDTNEKHTRTESKISRILFRNCIVTPGRFSSTLTYVNRSNK